VKALLQRTNLLTLTGSGGTGKTRLSLQVAADVLEDYPDGVRLVELAALTDPALVPQTVATALGIREAPNEPMTTTLVTTLKAKQMLLVLDNCEHLLDASANLVDVLLKSCPKLRVLASSREALGIGGESAYRVPSLTVPPPPLSSPLEKGGARGVTPHSLSEYESVRLFIERAVAANTAFAVTSKNALSLASVCHHLDGIPLAIELAAARVRAMPVDEIEARLDSRFRLLTGGSRTAQPRQQTLKALIDWSYDLLNEPERSLLGRLSVFSGGWRLEAAEAVCSGKGIEEWEILDLLTSLVDKSLVVYEEREAEARYRMLETVRQYARDRLVESGESDVVRERHRDYFLALSEEAESKLSGPEQGVWLERLEEEHENLRVGQDWSLSEAASGEALRFCGALQRFWWTRGHLWEGRERCVRALGATGGQERTSERGKAFNGAGVLVSYQGDYASARAYFEESLTIQREIGDRSGISFSLEAFASLAARESRSERAAALLAGAEALREEIGVPIAPHEREQRDRDLSEARQALGEEAFTSAWERGRAMTMEQAIEYALQEVR
jgi:non-specific serine/threonine protein kinase